MAIDTEICNLAISHLGVGKEISDAETEVSQEAKACRRFYKTALASALRHVEWPFATSFKTLALVTEDPTEEWQYSYSYPVDAVKIRRLLPSVRNESLQTQVKYRIVKGASSLEVYTDQENAQAEITEYIEEPLFYPSDFKMAFSYMLAHYLAPRLTNGDPFKMRAELFALFQQEASGAGAASFNESKFDEQVETEYIRARY